MWLLLFLATLTTVNAFNLRIIGGSSTTIDRYPYQVSLHYNNAFKCGGSLISQNWVLTAAHCVVGYSPQRFQIRVQSTNIQKGGTLISNVKGIRIHDLYDDDYLSFDAALIELPSSIPITANSKPIPLAASQSTVEAGSKAVVTGWGLTSVGGSSSDTLQMLSMPVIAQDKCRDVYKAQRPVTDAMLCAGSMSGSQDVCGGDSGGPLVCNGVQIGIVSWGYKCAERGYPGVYTRLSNPSVRSWITRWAKV